MTRFPDRRWCAALLPGLLAGACAHTSPLVHQQCLNADAQLAAVWQPLDAQRAKGCAASVEPGAPDCDRLRHELERLALVCADHAPTLMANAVIAYEDHEPVKSQQLLDQILAQPRSFPDAAALRARIAIEEGNLPFARRLLEQQMTLAPDHPGLRETYGAALYVAGQLPEARRELAAARTLGAPAWRIAYHLGLIEEATGRLDLAAQYYAEALQGNPGWAQAASRLKALRAKSQ
jgi:tetratricopeptide (TPR) repeat protein